MAVFQDQGILTLALSGEIILLLNHRSSIGTLTYMLPVSHQKTYRLAQVWGKRMLAKVPGYGAKGAQFESLYALAKDSLAVKPALQALS